MGVESDEHSPSPVSEERASETAEAPELPAPLVAMIAATPLEALEELAHYLRAHLARQPHSRTRRWGELGALATLMEAQRDKGSFTGYVSQVDYDDKRPADAPSAMSLAKRFGDWSWALRAADGLQPDGRTRGPSSPWPHTERGRSPRHQPYTLEEIHAAIQACTAATGRVPTIARYEEWARRERAKARALGKAPARVPSSQTIYRRVGSWQAVLRGDG